MRNLRHPGQTEFWIRKVRGDVVEDGMKVHCCDRTQVTFTNGLVGSCGEHHKIDDVSNRRVVAESRKPAPYNPRTPVDVLDAIRKNR
jgi:hypothetical protein